MHNYGAHLTFVVSLLYFLLLLLYMKKYETIKNAISDRKLAALAGVNRRTLIKWKRGESVTERTERKIEHTVNRLWGAIEGGE